MRRVTPILALLTLAALAVGLVAQPQAAHAQAAAPGQTFTAALNATSGATSTGGIALVASSTGARYRVRSFALASSSAGVLMIKSGNVQESTPRVAVYLAANVTTQVTPDMLGQGVALDRGEALVLEIAAGNVSGFVTYQKD